MPGILAMMARLTEEAAKLGCCAVDVAVHRCAVRGALAAARAQRKHGGGRVQLPGNGRRRQRDAVGSQGKGATVGEDVGGVAVLRRVCGSGRCGRVMTAVGMWCGRTGRSNSKERGRRGVRSGGSGSRSSGGRWQREVSTCSRRQVLRAMMSKGCGRSSGWTSLCSEVKQRAGGRVGAVAASGWRAVTCLAAPAVVWASARRMDRRSRGM